MAGVHRSFQARRAVVASRVVSGIYEGTFIAPIGKELIVSNNENDYEQNAERIEEFATRLIDAYMHRAGSEDSGRVLDDLEDSSENLVADLGRLVLTLAFKAADAMTVYDITDPERRVTAEKIDQLRELLADGLARWALEQKEANDG